MDCNVTGPHYLSGVQDWICETHGVFAELINPTRYGTRNLRPEDFYCPEAFDE